MKIQKLLVTMTLSVTVILFFTSARATDTYLKSPKLELGQKSVSKTTRIAFSVDTFSGTASYTAQLPLPKGRAGLTPTVSLVYSSQRGIGWPARGWNLPMLCIKRNTKFGVPTYDNSKDKFIFQGSGSSLDLVRINNESNIWEYRAKIEGAFSRYRFNTSENRWEIWEKSGIIHYLGGIDISNSTYYARQVVGGIKTFKWCVARTQDSNKNYISYYYDDSTQFDAQIYPKKIEYTESEQQGSPSPIHEIQFEYEAFTGNKHTSFRSGHAVVLNNRSLKKITLLTKNALGTHKPRRSLHITYDHNLGGNTGSDTVITQLQIEGISEAGTSLFDSPVKFSYYKNEGAAPNSQKVFSAPIDISIPSLPSSLKNVLEYSHSTVSQTYSLRSFIDMNGDGLKDYVRADAYNPVTVPQWESQFTFDSDNQEGPDTVEWAVHFQKPDGSFTSAYKWRFAKDDCSSRCSIRKVNNFYVAGNILSGTGTQLDMIDIDGDGKPDHVEQFSLTGGIRWRKNNGHGFDEAILLDNSSNTKIHDVSQLSGQVSATFAIETFLDMNGDGLPSPMFRDGSQSKLFVQQNCFNPLLNCSGFSTESEWTGSSEAKLQHGTQSSGVTLDGGTPIGAGSFLLREFIDINGDGLPDLLRVDSAVNKVKFQYNDGVGFISSSTDLFFKLIGVTQIEHLTGSGNQVLERRASQLIDIDGDGLVDYVEAKEFTNNIQLISAWFNKGSGVFSQKTDLEIGDLGINSKTLHRSHSVDFSEGGTKRHSSTLMFTDLNGDGKPDFLFVYNPTPTTNGWRIQKGIYPPPYLLKEIDNSRGHKVTFTYKPSTQFNDPNAVPPDPNLTYKSIPYTVNLVSSTKSENFGSPSETKVYTYSNGFYEHTTKEFRGFGQVIIQDSKGRKDGYLFAQGEYNQGILTSHSITTLDNSTPPQTLYYSLTSNSIGEKLITPATSPWIKFPYIKEKKVEYLEKLYIPNTINSKWNLFEYRYDDNGNLTHEMDFIQNACVKYNYKAKNSSTEYIFALRQKSLIPNPLYGASAGVEPCVSNAERVTQFFHDNSTSDISHITIGNLTRTKRCKDPSCSSFTTTDYQHDPYGNVTQTTDPNQNITQITYDSQSKTHPSHIINPKGHSKYIFYDQGIGKVISVRGPNSTDPNNIDTKGEEYRFEYDPLGRMVRRFVPTFDGANYISKLSTEWTYSLATDALPHFSQKDTIKSFDQSERIAIRAFFNGFGQPIQVRTSHLASQFSVIDKKYDSLGRLEKISRPYLSTDPHFTSQNFTLSTSYEYDHLNRITKLSHPNTIGNPAFVTYEYMPWHKKITDESGKVKEHIYNSLGKISEVREHENTIYSQVLSTFYYYNTWGELKIIRDSIGNDLYFIYDNLGRRTNRISFPAYAGYTIASQENYQYDDAGNRIHKTDNNNLTIQYSYDSIHRLLEVTYPSVNFAPWSTSNLYPLGQNSNFKIKYTYDAQGLPHSLGRLSRVDDSTGHSEFIYDSLGRVTNKVVNHCQAWYSGACISYNWYQLDFEYNAIGKTRIIHHTGNTPTEVAYSYDAAGRVYSVTSPQHGNLSLSTFTYNPDNTINQKISGFNTVIDHVYDADRGFLKEVRGTKINNTSYSILHHEYDYLPSGHIERFRDLKPKQNHPIHEINYGYDDLYRLISMSSEQLGQRSYTYSYNGNMTSKLMMDSNSNVIDNFYYMYGGTPWGGGFVNGHAVTGLITNSNWYEYSYGYNGNMKRKESYYTSQRWRYYYDLSNKLRMIHLVDKNTNAISQETGFYYQYNGNRIHQKTTQSGVTQEDKVYIDGLMEINRLTNMYDVHVFANGNRIASIRNAGNSSDVYLYHQTQVKSTSAVTNSNGDVVDERGYFPFGTQYTLGGTQSGLEYQFNGKESSSWTGLHYYGSRYYDPLLSRWLSSDKYLYHPDKIIESPQHLNLYSFSLNDPINQYDSNGKLPIMLPVIAAFATGALVGAAWDVTFQLGLMVFTNHKFSWKMTLFSAGLGGLFGGVGMLSRGLKANKLVMEHVYDLNTWYRTKKMRILHSHKGKPILVDGVTPLAGPALIFEKAASGIVRHEAYHYAGQKGLMFQGSGNGMFNVIEEFGAQLYATSGNMISAGFNAAAHMSWRVMVEAAGFMGLQLGGASMSKKSYPYYKSCGNFCSVTVEKRK